MISDEQLEHLLITAKAEYQTLKNEEKDVVIRGKSLARIYRQLIDVIGQLKAERTYRKELKEAIEEWAIAGNIHHYGNLQNIIEAIDN